MFTKPLVKQIASEIEVAVQEIAKKHDISITYGGGNFLGFDCTIKLRLAAIGKEADEENAAYAKMLGLPEDIVGKTFINKLSTFTITRLDINKIKYPVLARNQNDLPYKFTVDAVKGYMKLK